MFLFVLIVIFFCAKPQQIFAVDQIIKITNFSSNTLPEWVEINNNTENTIDLNKWIIKDDNNISSDDIPLSGCISPHSFQTFYKESGWLNNDGDVIYLYDNNNQLIDKLSYESGKIETSPKSDNVCTPTPTPTSFPTLTLTPTPTPTSKPTSTPTPTKSPTPTKIPTPTITITPTKVPTISVSVPTPTVEIAITLEPSITPEAEILGAQTTTSEIIVSNASKPKNNKIGIIFIIVGGLLLLTPVIFTKFHFFKKNS